VVRDRACHGTEYEVTRVVAVFVVEALEVVDDHHDGDRLAASLGAVQFAPRVRSGYSDSLHARKPH
jgi:hypothetical protein